MADDVAAVAVKIRVAMNALPPETLQQAGECIDEAGTVLYPLAEETNDVELAEAIATMGGAREEIDRVWQVCRQIQEVCRKYLANIGAVDGESPAEPRGSLPYVSEAALPRACSAGAGKAHRGRLRCAYGGMAHSRRRRGRAAAQWEAPGGRAARSGVSGRCPQGVGSGFGAAERAADARFACGDQGRGRDAARAAGNIRHRSQPCGREDQKRLTCHRQLPNFLPADAELTVITKDGHTYIYRGQRDAD